MTRSSRTIILAVSLFLAGCNPGGSGNPPSTEITSAAIPTLLERTAFLNRYITFKRTYETLDFDIHFQNNAGGRVPGPSDGDIRIVATVPAAELQAWVPASAKPAAAAPDIAWVKSVPTSIDLSGVTEWYVDGNRVVGIDRKKRIVVYRTVTT